jgi:ABC-type lipoprotein export system ATPase subunit
MGPAELKVLRNCTLYVDSGEFVAIMGKSGSGKSTLLHILGALDLPQQGEVYFHGSRVCGAQTRLERLARHLDSLARTAQRVIKFFVLYIAAPVFLGAVGLLLLLGLVHLGVRQARLLFPYWTILFRVGLVLAASALLTLLCYLLLLLGRLALVTIIDWRRDRLRRKAFGFVFQFYHLLPELTVLENVLLPRMVAGFTSSWWWEKRRARTDALSILDRVGLRERIKHKPNELSGGECQRVAIARALVHKPQILFADEPTGNLDAEAGANIMSILTGLHREGQTIIMVTHDAGIAGYADRVLLLEEGRLRPA